VLSFCSRCFCLLLTNEFMFDCRVSQISLVCKKWKSLERAYAYQALKLIFDPADTSASIAWQLRDSSKLEEVRFIGLADESRCRRPVGRDAAFVVSSISRGPCLAEPGSEHPRPLFPASAILPARWDAHPAGVPEPGKLAVPPQDIPLLSHLTGQQNLKATLH